MKSRRAVLIHSPELEQYEYPPECPFKAFRAKMLRELLVARGLLSEDMEVAPRPAPRECMEMFHTPEYLDTLRRASAGEFDASWMEMGIGTMDCPVFPGMYEYAALACGGSLLGARMVERGQAGVAFNPSGGYHHAGREKAAGFCYINDVAVACMNLASRGNRVFFLDIDGHHGDGVQNAFYERKDVMTVSFHESGRTLFPGTGFVDEIGDGGGRGYCVNVPLPMGTGDTAYLRAFRAIALPLLDAYGPDIIVLEAGMDALSGDPLVHLGLTNNAHAEITGLVMETGLPVLATGGGGYNLDNTVRGWALIFQVMCGRQGYDESAGLGGVMLENTDWAGGMRDRTIAVETRRRAATDNKIGETIEAVKANVFGIHGL